MAAIKNFLFQVRQKLIHMAQKNVWGDTSIFLEEEGHLTPKFNILSFFYHKFDAKYFHVKQFFLENQY